MNFTQQGCPRDQLRKDAVYQLYYRKAVDEGYVKKEMAVFCHQGDGSFPIFHPLGEPSFQDVFGLKDYETKWVAVFVREGKPEDLGY